MLSGEKLMHGKDSLSPSEREIMYQHVPYGIPKGVLFQLINFGKSHNVFLVISNTKHARRFGFGAHKIE